MKSKRTPFRDSKKSAAENRPAAGVDRDSRKTKKYRIPAGGSARLYVIDPEAMDSEGGGA